MRRVFNVAAVTRKQFSSASAAPKLQAQDVDMTALLDGALGTALTPNDTVEKLDQYVVGQAAAKKAVAIAMRNRWRRQQLPDYIKNEIVPKNILMVGPTGCGKTEVRCLFCMGFFAVRNFFFLSVFSHTRTHSRTQIARRISKISQAPFLKVEATKFTEVGFHGRDVDQIIKV